MLPLLGSSQLSGGWGVHHRAGNALAPGCELIPQCPVGLRPGEAASTPISLVSKADPLGCPIKMIFSKAPCGAPCLTTGAEGQSWLVRIRGSQEPARGGGSAHWHRLHWQASGPHCPSC